MIWIDQTISQSRGQVKYKGKYLRELLVDRP
jgi:hypothetical protein